MKKIITYISFSSYYKTSRKDQFKKYITAYLHQTLDLSFKHHSHIIHT